VLKTEHKRNEASPKVTAEVTDMWALWDTNRNGKMSKFEMVNVMQVRVIVIIIIIMITIIISTSESLLDENIIFKPLAPLGL
jgi:hypothetical protein